MTTDQFVALFGSQCTVGLNWRMITRDQPRVDLRTITGRGDLGRLLIPQTQLADRRDPAAAHITVRQLAVDLSKRDDAAAILKLASAFARQSRSSAILLPAYRVSKRRTLLLDGLHRAVALWIADRPIRVALAVLRGPTDPGMSWDMEWIR